MLEGVLYEALAYILYIREGYYFSLICTSERANNFFEVMVDVHKGFLRFREEIDYRCVNFIHFTFSFIVVIWSLSIMATMHVLVRVCIWVLGV